MVEGGGPGSESGSRSKPASSLESAGGRLRFRVELRPGETTIVSWKKLLKEATFNQPTNGTDLSVVGPSSEAQQPTSQAPLPPYSDVSSKHTVAENESKDLQAQPGSNRLNNVIERIERMYAGNGSSDEEDVVLDDVPDDDEYDTDDSFIDDAELDDYFQVDNSAIKHDGFFVNRGKLERIEPTISANQQPKKRRRKDVGNQGGLDDGHNPAKQVKIGDKGRKASSIEKKVDSQSNRVAVPNAQGSKITVGPSGMSNGDPLGPDKDTDQQRTGVLPLQGNNKQKEGTELQDIAIRRSIDRSSYENKSQSGKTLANADGSDSSMKQKEKAALVERFDLNFPASKDSLQTYKAPLLQRKEGSSVRPKSTMLDKAIKELEKIVAESRPPSREVQDPDSSSQAIKRRLPPEIKQKLAKVARLAQVNYGKIPKDVINRLMSIVGHLMQLRTLKRNLKVMANLGLSVKQEKDDQLQKIKQEVADMVKLRNVYMKYKVEQQNASLDVLQEAGRGDKETLKQKYSMDNTLENKICDLYDLYVERLEEESGPPVRRLYEELAALWPSGVMDTEGVKRAISRAKDRRRTLTNRRKDQDKIKKTKVLTPKPDDVTRGEETNITQMSNLQEKLSVPRDHAATSTSKSNVSAALAHPATCAPVSSGNIQDMDKARQEKMKGNSGRNPVDAGPTDILPKKKVKRKPDSEMVEGQLHPEKVPPQAGERHKHHKPMAAPSLKQTSS
ncbi:bromodomain adjacent to zinc finger domain protein 2B-like [Dorcoceras hygrometricum]|uniref:Bromodomain adjacent to zinc finger domain protein 2B-like n=1 Tax=Dorcoceras hygrometricum TaxID=472368 RepID=A0A2Z7A524_9LAMI|nr:bromodomain adjacent to zinc finger domain protein 2B-like [Dorcoceras hygrometricum]